MLTLELQATQLSALAPLLPLPWAPEIEEGPARLLPVGPLYAQFLGVYPGRDLQERPWPVHPRVLQGTA